MTQRIAAHGPSKMIRDFKLEKVTVIKGSTGKVRLDHGQGLAHSPQASCTNPEKGIQPSRTVSCTRRARPCHSGEGRVMIDEA